MPVDENGMTNPWHDISREDFENIALKKMISYKEGKDLPEGHVPETFFFLWNDNEIVGQFRIRHYLTDALREGAGHIGYFIKKEFRNKGFGKAGLKLTLEKAKEIIPEDEVYLRVNKDNISSLKVMLSCGGEIHHEDENKYYVRIKR